MFTTRPRSAHTVSLLPPHDKGTGAAIARQADWATALPTRPNVQEWSRAAALTSRTELAAAIKKLLAEESPEVQATPLFQGLFNMTKLYVKVQNGIPIGEGYGCENAVWEDGGKNVTVMRNMYINQAGWSLAAEAGDTPALLVAGPGKTRGAKVDLRRSSLQAAQQGQLVHGASASTASEKAGAPATGGGAAAGAGAVRAAPAGGLP